MIYMPYAAGDFLKAIDGSGGFITTIAKRVGCTRQTVYNAMERYATVKQAIADEKDSLKDMAENELLRQIKDGNTTATIFYLKTQAKDRGYVERQEFDHSGKINVTELTDDELHAIIEAKG